LIKLSPAELLLELHPDDASVLGVSDHDRVTIDTRRGSLVARAFITSILQPGHVFLPMHDPQVNRLTDASFDPHSRQHSYKASAVALKRL